MELSEVRPLLPQKEILGVHPEVFWQEGLGQGNVSAVLEKHRVANREFWRDLAGQTVWVRPNMAEPAMPDSCTSPQTLHTVIEKFALEGVTDIRIGDVPAVATIEAIKNGETTYEALADKLGYAKIIQEASEKFPDTEFSLLDPTTLRTVELGDTGLSVYEPPEGCNTVVSLVLPKEHGQYEFTCGSKSLMGMTHPDGRVGYFHNHGNNHLLEQISGEYNDIFIRAQTGELNTDEMEWLENLSQDALKESGLTKQELEKDLANEKFAHAMQGEFAKRVYLEAAKRTDPANADKMATFISELSGRMSADGVRLFTVVDGTSFMTGHEHDGAIHDLNMAACGENPLSVDLAVATRVGVKTPQYLADLNTTYKIKPDVRGEFRKDVPLRQSKRGVRDFSVVDGRPFFLWSVDSDIPQDGFAGKEIPQQRVGEFDATPDPQSPDKPESDTPKQSERSRKSTAEYGHMYKKKLRKFRTEQADKTVLVGEASAVNPDDGLHLPGETIKESGKYELEDSIILKYRKILKEIANEYDTTGDLGNTISSKFVWNFNKWLNNTKHNAVERRLNSIFSDHIENRIQWVKSNFQQPFPERDGRDKEYGWNAVSIDEFKSQQAIDSFSDTFLSKLGLHKQGESFDETKERLAKQGINVSRHEKDQNVIVEYSSDEKLMPKISISKPKPGIPRYLLKTYGEVELDFSEEFILDLLSCYPDINNHS